MGRIIIVAGPPGVGKTTISEQLALQGVQPLTANLTTDHFFGYVRQGFIPPWFPESQNQNATVLGAAAAAAAVLAVGGYEVYVDGVVAPWFLQMWLDTAERVRRPLHYVMLMPNEAEAIARATARTSAGAMVDGEVSRLMWRRFDTAEAPPGCKVDSSGQSIETTVAEVRAGLNADRFRVFQP